MTRPEAAPHPPLSKHTKQPASWVPHPIRACRPSPGLDPPPQIPPGLDSPLSDPPLVWTLPNQILHWSGLSPLRTSPGLDSPRSDPPLIWTLRPQTLPWSGLSPLRPSPRTSPWPPVGGLRGLLGLINCQLSRPFWAAGVLSRKLHLVNSVPAPAVSGAWRILLDLAC